MGEACGLCVRKKMPNKTDGEQASTKIYPQSKKNKLMPHIHQRFVDQDSSYEFLLLHLTGSHVGESAMFFGRDKHEDKCFVMLGCQHETNKPEEKQ